MAPFLPLLKKNKFKSTGFTISQRVCKTAELIRDKEAEFRRQFPEYRGSYVHNRYDGEPCYARMGVVYCSCKACRCLGMAERKFLYGQQGETGFPDEYKLVRGCSYFLECDYCQLFDAFFGDSTQLMDNDSLNKRLATIRRNKKKILELFPGFEGDKLVWDEDGHFCFFRMNLVNCTCIMCEGLKLRRNYINYAKLIGLTDYTGPSDQPGFCRFEQQAYENKKWSLENPEFKPTDVSLLFDINDSLPIDIV